MAFWTRSFEISSFVTGIKVKSISENTFLLDLDSLDDFSSIIPYESNK